MPLFEYKCRKCGHQFEELIFGDKAAICPVCQSENTEKLLSAFATGPSTSRAISKSSSCTNFT